MNIKTTRIAGIDIGSNAMRLIINEITKFSDSDYFSNKLAYLRLPIRLGGSVFTLGYIDEAKENELIKGLIVYKDMINFFDVYKYKACATSAMRSATNNIQVIQKIKEIVDIDIEIIDAYTEAELLFYVNKEYLQPDKYYLSADLGGGSIQLSVFFNNKILWSKSFEIGTVRMLNNKVSYETYEEFKETLRWLKNKYKKINVIGTGGNINKLSSLVGKKNVELNKIEKFYKEIEPMSIYERMKKYELRQDRADVIAYACKVYIDLMKTLEVDEIFIPKAGLADGIIRKIYENEF